MSQNSRPEWDAVSACDPVGKPHPASITNSGLHFPSRPSTGNGIPFLGQILGCSFHRALQLETASHSKGKFRDAASATPPIRKAHPTLDTSGYGIISHLLGIGSATWRPPGGALLHESHRVMRKEARIRLVAVLHLAIHPANARDCIIQNRLIIRMMEISPPQTLATAHPRVKKKPREFRGFHVCIISSARRRLSTRPARPFWRLQPCCPDPPWWDDPLRQPSCRATT